MIYKEYFASMNTGGGFKSYFNKIFSPIELTSLYIIKGGSGTGKSTLMKNIAERFKKEERDVEGFLCSADINSWDGVIIDKSVAVIDGTSPHVTDTVYTGAVDELIDLGTCLENNLLKKHRQEIINNVDEKSSCYKKAYSFLSASCQVKNEIERIASEGLDYDKMQGAITRFFRQNGLKGEGVRESVRLIESVTGDGAVRLETFESLSEKICCITNSHGCESIFFDCFLKSVRECGLEALISFSPYSSGKVNGIYLPECKMSLVLERGGEDVYDTRYKMFNLERFLDREVLTQNRSKLRFAKKCADALLNGAADLFREAGVKHKALEEIYRESVDFDAVSEISDGLYKKIEKALVTTEH